MFTESGARQFFTSMSSHTISLEKTKSISLLLVDLISKLEKFRIQTHLQRVELLLRSKSVDHLREALKISRQNHLDTLREYWEAGTFPSNNLFKNRTPFFVDRFGTPCAMAYLIKESGEADLVSVVANTNNHVYIDDLAHGPVIDWIQGSGLSKEEAAQIQPSYEFMYSCGPDSYYYRGDVFCNPTLFNLISHYLPIIITIALSCVVTWCLYKLASWSYHESKPKRYGSRTVFGILFSSTWVLLALTIINYTGFSLIGTEVLVEYIDFFAIVSLILLASGCVAASLILLPKKLWFSENIWEKNYAFVHYFFVSLLVCIPITLFVTQILKLIRIL